MESVRQSMMKFALSFLIVGDTSVISAILQLKGWATCTVLIWYEQPILFLSRIFV